MSIMANRALLIASCLIWVVGSAAAAPGAAQICGVRVGQKIGAIAPDIDQRVVSSAVPISLATLGDKVPVQRIELRFNGKCKSVGSAGSGEDAPDLIVDAVRGVVVMLTYRPAIQDCQAVISLVTLVAGPPDASSGEVAEWQLSTAGHKIFVTSYAGDYCWISHQIVDGFVGKRPR